MQEKLALDQIPLWSHLTKLKTRIQESKLFPSDYYIPKQSWKIFTEIQKISRKITMPGIQSKLIRYVPGWCGSADWVPAYEPKGHQLDSQSGHMPGLWSRSPVGAVQEQTTHWCFSPSVPPSFPLSLKINKIFKKLMRYSEKENVIYSKEKNESIETT